MPRLLSLTLSLLSLGLAGTAAAVPLPEAAVRRLNSGQPVDLIVEYHAPQVTVNLF